MYITNIQHFLDNKGDIPKKMSKEARKRASYFALVIDTTTKNNSTAFISTDIRCFEKRCQGMIKTELRLENDEIIWFCPDCKVEGVISGWQGTKWDNIHKYK